MLHSSSEDDDDGNFKSVSILQYENSLQQVRNWILYLNEDCNFFNQEVRPCFIVGKTGTGQCCHRWSFDIEADGDDIIWLWSFSMWETSSVHSCHHRESPPILCVLHLHHIWMYLCKGWNDMRLFFNQEGTHNSMVI